MRRLDGMVALVTGGASGLGRAIAQRIHADGAEVVITDTRVDVGEKTAEECGFMFVEQDVSDEARWPHVICEVEERFGHVNVLVNNAGVLGTMDAINPENIRLEDWRAVFAVNVEGVLLGCRAAIPAMRKAGGGSIINIASVAGLRPSPHAVAYGCSKAAVRQLTKTVAQYCVQENLSIRCNSVHPGIVKTPLWGKYAEETARMRGVSASEFVAETLARIPMGDFTVPEDVAAAVSFLASEDARHITGEKLIVDGGMVSCSTYRYDPGKRRRD